MRFNFFFYGSLDPFMFDRFIWSSLYYVFFNDSYYYYYYYDDVYSSFSFWKFFGKKSPMLSE